MTYVKLTIVFIACQLIFLNYYFKAQYKRIIYLNPALYILLELLRKVGDFPERHKSSRIRP